MGIEAITKTFAGDKNAKNSKGVIISSSKNVSHENLRSSQFNFKVLTKEEIEKDRCRAYNYAL
jgi:hypothetical protein